MTNEEFWEKPANAVYVTPAVSKVGVAVIIGMMVVLGLAKLNQKQVMKKALAHQETIPTQHVMTFGKSQATLFR